MSASICVIRHRDFGELALRREVEALARAGYDVHVICLRGPGQHDSPPAGAVSAGIHVHAVPLERERAGALRYFVDYASFFVAATFLVSYLHLRNRFRVVQVNTMPDFLVFCSIVPKLLGARVIVFMKEPTPELGVTKFGTGRWNRALEWFEQAALRYADLAITVTEQLKHVYVRRGADPHKIRVVLNGPDAAHLRGSVEQPLPEPADGGDRFVLLCHGAIEPRYGHETVVRAVARARADVPGLRFRIAGAGSDSDRIATLVRELGIEGCVELLGWLPLEDLTRELAYTDVGVVAQESSPYSNLVHTNKMFDYIVFEKPVIATRLESVRAYFGDDSLCFVEPGDVDGMARAIVDLHRDAERRRTLVANASALYQRYGWDQQASAFLEAYDEVVAA